MDSESIVNQLQDNYSADYDLYTEESWNTDQNDSVFAHDYLVFVKARNLLEDQTYLEIQDKENDPENVLPEDNDDEQESNTGHKIPVTETTLEKDKT